MKLSNVLIVLLFLSSCSLFLIAGTNKADIKEDTPKTTPKEEKNIVEKAEAPKTLPNPPPAAILSHVEALQEVFANVAERAFPATVVITTKQRRNMSRMIPFDELPIDLQALFLMNGYRFQTKESEMESVPAGVGSGFIVHEDGYIVTNYHVIRYADEAEVTLHSGEKYNAKLVGADDKTDLAVLKIDSKNKFHTLQWGNSDQAKIGHFVIAIGTPFQLKYSMTSGIISQKGRAVGLNIYENYIQTDASINPGNSGGPLLNIRGEVIGVNDFIVTGGQSRGSVGLGFAIPSAMAQDIVDQLIKKGTVTRPYIGILLQEISETSKKRFKLPPGILITNIFDDFPADQAGIKKGDYIIAINGKETNSIHDLQMQTIAHRPGDKITLTIIRDEKKIDFEITIGAYEDKVRFQQRNKIKIPDNFI